MSNLGRIRFTKYNTRTLGYFLENKQKIDKSQLAHLTAIQESTVGLDEFKTSFDFITNKKDKDCSIAKLGYGRVYGKVGAGAYLDNNYRHNLYAKTQHDIDMFCCHPVILIQMAKDRKIEMNYLKEYVDNREEYIKQVIEYYGKIGEVKTRTAIKTEIIATMYGAEIPTFKNLHKELEYLYEVLITEHVQLHTEIKSKKLKNAKGTFLSLIAQTEERKCLEAMDSYFLYKNRSVDDLAYDGLMVRKLYPDEVFPNELLRGAEECIYEKTGYKMRLEIKPMIQTIDDSLLQSKTEKTEKTYFDMKIEFEKKNMYYEPNNTIIHINNDNYLEFRTIEHTRESYGSLILPNGKSFVDTWRKDGSRRVITKLVYKKDEDLEDGELSLFTGFQYLKYKPSDDIKEHIEIFDDLVMALCNDEKEIYKYVLDTFTHILKKPFEKTGVLLSFVSKQTGIGKDTLFLILKNIIGNRHFAHYTSTEQYWDKYDTQMEGAIIVYLEEACCNLPKKQEAELRARVTSDILSINPKGNKAYTVQNICRTMLSSNGQQSIDPNDRRKMCSMCSPRLKNNKEFFNKIYRFIKQQDFIRNIGDYLMSRDITNWNPTPFPETQYRIEMKELSESSERRFLLDWKLTNDDWIASTDLYRIYKQYCIDNSLTYCQSVISFGKKILFEKDLYESRINPRRVKEYKSI
jgi:hypothetical protein